MATGSTRALETGTLDTLLDQVGVLTLALYTVAPAEDGTGGTEVSTSGTAYARIAINAASTQFAAAVAGTSTNPSTKLGPTGAAVWAFAAPTANWGTVVAAAVIKAGVIQWVATLTSSQTVNSGDPAPQFDSSHQLTFQAGQPGDSF